MTVSYQDLILGTDGLLGYYPLYENGIDASGLLDDMQSHGDVEFSRDVISPGGFGHYKGASGNDYVELDSGLLSVNNPMGTLAVETWVTFDHQDGKYNSIFGFNQQLGEQNNNLRLMLIQGYLNNMNLFSAASNTFDIDFDHFKTPKHIVMQYETDSDQTIIYSNGESLFSISGSVFHELLANGKYFVGCFSYGNAGLNRFYCNSDSSDLAFYNRPLTKTEILERVNYNRGSIQNRLLRLSSVNWSNRETRAQANPQPDVLQYLKQSQLPTLATKQGNYLGSIDQKGNQRKMGFFESKVLIQDVPAPNRKVMCFTQNGQLLDETRSDSLGTYRFDHLLLDTKYLFVAQDNRATPDTPPEYQAVAAGFQSATPYVED